MTPSRGPIPGRPRGGGTVAITGPAIKVLVVDDSEEFLLGVCGWVASQRHLRLAGAARSGEEAIAAAERLEPDLVLMDIAMKGMDGLETTRRIKSKSPAPLVVILTFHATQVVRQEAWVAGADGFVAKADVSDDLLRVIESLFAPGSAGAEDDAGGPSREVTNPGARGRLVSAGEESPESCSGRSGAPRRTE